MLTWTQSEGVHAVLVHLRGVSRGFVLLGAGHGVSHMDMTVVLVCSCVSPLNGAPGGEGDGLGLPGQQQEGVVAEPAAPQPDSSGPARYSVLRLL